MTQARRHVGSGKVGGEGVDTPILSPTLPRLNPRHSPDH